MAKSSKKKDSSSNAPSVAIIVSRYNHSITEKLHAGAVEEFESRFGSSNGLVTTQAPGAFELPMLASIAAASGHFQAVVCLGCVIKGETSHDHHISSAVANGLTTVSIAHQMPVAFGVLTVDTPQQAADRAGGAHGNKGQEAMSAALNALAAAKKLKKAQDFTVKTPSKDKAKAKPQGSGKSG